MFTLYAFTILVMKYNSNFIESSEYLVHNLLDIISCYVLRLVLKIYDNGRIK